MKKIKMKMYIIILVLILIIFLIGMFIVKYNKKYINEIEEYIPAEEISDIQMRQTNIELYFYNNETGEIERELRKIDVKSLIENPEKILLELLFEGPKNNNLLKIIPEGTYLMNSSLEKGILTINLSEEFRMIENLDIKMKNNVIESIYKTLMQLNEFNNIKILLNSEEYII